ncbi:MAG: hypothetical protein QM780_06915 [Hyphomicrobium sp.]|uniref:hypothetical protein n=1 Tax=Hyphomicrobium sp. TaxID=82 RepID=UPI0039E58C35
MSEQSNDKFPPSISVTRLYERTSAKGNPYMTGRMGGVKIAVLKTNDTDDEGHPIWELKFSPAPAKPRQTEAFASPRSASNESARGFGTAGDDIIPF